MVHNFFLETKPGKSFKFLNIFLLATTFLILTFRCRPMWSRSAQGWTGKGEGRRWRGASSSHPRSIRYHYCCHILKSFSFWLTSQTLNPNWKEHFSISFVFAGSRICLCICICICIWRLSYLHLYLYLYLQALVKQRCEISSLASAHIVWDSENYTITLLG